ncbi:MAG TPA: tRNA (guanosine(37)-N1)-methyltransferase TrmD [Clostridia bacterium]|nr:tRNA (guanosine(37)-N1)-methyltransferase TrmD [Clostridia bacterium]
MQINVLTLFPGIYNALNESVIGRALEKGLFQVNVYNIRDFSKDKHKKCDDEPFGGGAGMVMTAQPIHDAIKAIDGAHECFRIYLSPKGQKLNQKMVKRLSEKKNLLLLNGAFEGVDERVIELDIDMELSIGDYVITSGDFASLVLINSISRYIDGVLGSPQSITEESFSSNLLEYPQYTRPQVFEGLEVPAVLLSGNHAEIEKWRKEVALSITKKRRPDLLEE